MELLSLPNDQLISKLVELKLSEINSLCQASSLFQDRICQNDDFWKAKFQHDYPALSNTINIGLIPRYSGWKQAIIAQVNLWKIFQSFLDEFLVMTVYLPFQLLPPDYQLNAEDYSRLPLLSVFTKKGDTVLELSKYREKFWIYSEIFEIDDPVYQNQQDLVTRGLPDFYLKFISQPVHSIELKNNGIRFAFFKHKI